VIERFLYSHPLAFPIWGLVQGRGEADRLRWSADQPEKLLAIGYPAGDHLVLASGTSVVAGEHAHGACAQQ
jgi:hypothetical protein